MGKVLEFKKKPPMGFKNWNDYYTYLTEERKVNEESTTAYDGLATIYALSFWLAQIRNSDKE